MGKETPGTDQSADIAKHDIRSDGRRSGGIRDDVGGDLGIGESSKGECAGGDEECCSVADETLGGVGGEKHDVSDHHEGSAQDEEAGATVGFGGYIRDEEGEDCSGGVWGYGSELLLYAREGGIDSSDDSREEERETLDGDVVEEEDEGYGEGDGVPDS